jgi:ubiquinone/menaquinone biosynthesis C-methylase UbiE
MLKLAAYYIDAPEYKERLQVINFIEKDIVDYLESLEDDSIDLAIMKYTIDHIDNIDELFALLKRKLRKG